jgi:hypothetical protein
MLTVLWFWLMVLWDIYVVRRELAGDGVLAAARHAWVNRMSLAEARSLLDRLEV